MQKILKSKKFTRASPNSNTSFTDYFRENFNRASNSIENEGEFVTFFKRTLPESGDFDFTLEGFYSYCVFDILKRVATDSLCNILYNTRIIHQVGWGSGKALHLDSHFNGTMSLKARINTLDGFLSIEEKRMFLLLNPDFINSLHVTGDLDAIIEKEFLFISEDLDFLLEEDLYSLLEEEALFVEELNNVLLEASHLIDDGTRSLTRELGPAEAGQYSSSQLATEKQDLLGESGKATGKWARDIDYFTRILERDIDEATERIRYNTLTVFKLYSFRFDKKLSEDKKLSIINSFILLEEERFLLMYSRGLKGPKCPQSQAALRTSFGVSSPSPAEAEGINSVYRKDQLFFKLRDEYFLDEFKEGGMQDVLILEGILNEDKW